jgi:AraC family transcriptional regulator
MAWQSTDELDVSVTRSRVAQHGLGLVETLDVTGPREAKPHADSYSPDYQVCLPYRGAFVWHVGRDDVVADPNRVLFVTGDEAFRVSRPVDGGFAELIVTVRPELVAQLTEVAVRRLPRQASFHERSRLASPTLQRLAIELLHGQRHDDLLGEERLVEFLRVALACAPPAAAVSPSTRRLIGRAKAFLAAHLSAPVRLEHVARASGTTAAYLTTVFRRVEGQTLHKYLVQLRLARALVELPDTADITTLAADLGFANHSHFTAVFRRAFGCTPSAFRGALRRDRARLLALARVPANAGARA